MFTYTLIAIVILWAIQKKLKENFKTFSERGVKFEEPVIVFGNMFSGFRGKENILDIIQRLYDKFYNEK
jgi:tetraacyldisaccharide-1-P 4'-kinase